MGQSGIKVKVGGESQSEGWVKVAMDSSDKHSGPTVFSLLHCLHKTLVEKHKNH